MNKFSFCNLGGYDFQKLVNIFLTKQMGFGIEFYGGTKDRGRDGYFDGEAKFPPNAENWKGIWIFQAKFRNFIRRGENEMRKEIKDTLEVELNKIINKYGDKCDIYIYLTNVDLTQVDITSMKEIADKLEISHLVVIHFQHFEAFLDQNDRIKWQFPRLLDISDIEVIVKKALKEKSQAFLEELKDRMEVFANTNIFSKALDIFNKYNFVILYGPPKMGKTMIGTALCFISIREGYQIYDIIGPNDFFNLYKQSEKQLFMCDDVFGPISYDHIISDSWVRDLSKIIRKIDKNHSIIWTTRNVILQEALEKTRLYEYEEEIESEKVYVNVEDLTRVEKAHILYNHVKFSIGTQKIELRIKKYLIQMKYEIINHSNYSPELINKLCNFILPKINIVLDFDVFKNRILNFLNNPESDLIKNFDNLEEDYRILLLCLFSLGQRVQKKVLEKKFNKSMEKLGIRQLGKFNSICKKLTGTYIKRRSYFREIDIQFSHPSIMDLIEAKWCEEKGIQDFFLMVGGNYILRELIKKKALPSKKRKAFLETIFENEIFEEISLNLYIIAHEGSELFYDSDIEFIFKRLNEDFFEHYKENCLKFDPILSFINTFEKYIPSITWLKDLMYNAIENFNKYSRFFGDVTDLYEILSSCEQIDLNGFYELFDEFPQALESIKDILEGFKNDEIFFVDLNERPFDDEENKVKLAEALNPSIEKFNFLFSELNFHVEPINIDLEEYYKDFFDEKDTKEFEMIQKMHQQELQDEKNIIDYMFEDLED